MVPEEDIVVRLTAAGDLKACIDDWEFDVDSFESFVPDVIRLSAQLIRDLETFDSKMRLVNLLSVTTERLNTRVCLICSN